MLSSESLPISTKITSVNIEYDNTISGLDSITVKTSIDEMSIGPLKLTTLQRDTKTTEGMVIYNTDTKKLNYYNGTRWINISNQEWFIFSMFPYNNTVVSDYITELNINKYEGSNIIYSPIASRPTTLNAYHGAIYSPTQDRIYFIPNFIGVSEPLWHYMNASSGEIITYAHNMTGISQGGYIGGVYSPTLNRIYFVPYTQNTTLHYIDCNNGNIVSYTAPALCTGYIGGVYHPLLNRIYFIPYNISNSADWHYLDCSIGVVVSYTHGGVGIVANGFDGGCWDPINERLYFSPYAQSGETNWFYIDATGILVSYAKVVTCGSGIYSGACFSPTDGGRIYFCPYEPQLDYHYIDCSTGLVGSYTHGLTPIESGGYLQGCFSPTQNRIYLSPANQANQTLWHYIDCDTGTLVTYTAPTGQVVEGYANACYNPKLNRVVFTPFNQAAEATWVSIDCGTTIPNIDLMSSTIFNKY